MVEIRKEQLKKIEEKSKQHIKNMNISLTNHKILKKKKKPKKKIKKKKFHKKKKKY